MRVDQMFVNGAFDGVVVHTDEADDAPYIRVLSDSNRNMVMAQIGQEGGNGPCVTLWMSDRTAMALMYGLQKTLAAAPSNGVAEEAARCGGCAENLHEREEDLAKEGK